MIDFLKQINKENGVTIIVTSHDMDDLEEMAERILMISSGKLAFDDSFTKLRSITGNLTRVSVTMEMGFMPYIENSKLLSSNNGIFEYDVDLTKTPVRDLLSQLSTNQGVLDVEIRKAPIEQVIAGLYRNWNAS